MNKSLIQSMWEGEKKTHAFAVEMWKQRDEAREVILNMYKNGNANADELREIAKEYLRLIGRI